MFTRKDGNFPWRRLNFTNRAELLGPTVPSSQSDLHVWRDQGDALPALQTSLAHAALRLQKVEKTLL